ncbi:hypothetical protein [Paraburkholderia sediminicola]|uniref:hypothetical protein n=1 Tax=Paraburkholderia sediminicola TaxID=458836 RepID=UPI0038B94938
MTVPAGVFPTGTPNLLASGTLQTLNSALAVSTDTLGTIGASLTGTNTGATVIFEGTINGTTWDAIKVYPLIAGSAGVTSVSAAGDFEFNCAAFKQIRARLSVAGAGSFSVTLNGTAAIKHVGVKNGNAVDLQMTDASSASVPGRIALTVGTPATAGRSFCAICSVAGNVSVTFADGSVGIYPLTAGVPNVFPFQVTEVNTSGTTATATYENWK